MKGLEIARLFFAEWGRPFLQREFPDVYRRVATGRLAGSDVIGADDEISRDHCWGPQFTLWLSEADYAIHGERLSRIMNAAAPNPFRGHRLAGGGDQSVVVTTIPQWFQTHINISRLPEKTGDWQTINESGLYFVRHGTVWLDNLGQVTTWRKALHSYPVEVRRRRIAEECFRVWHHGEYNFVQRMARRRDPLAVALCLGEFVAGVMRIVLLLRGDFTPYWKWLPFEFRKLPDATKYGPELEALVRPGDFAEQVRIVKLLCDRVHEQLVVSGTVSGQGGNKCLLPLLNDYNELQARLAP